MDQPYRTRNTRYIFNKVHTNMTTQDRSLVSREGDLLDIPPPGPYSPRDPSTLIQFHPCPFPSLHSHITFLNLLGRTSASANTDGASITQLARGRRVVSNMKALSARRIDSKTSIVLFFLSCSDPEMRYLAQTICWPLRHTIDMDDAFHRGEPRRV
jgi:hypothetical protein